MVAEHRIGLLGYWMCIRNPQETIPVLDAPDQDTQSALHPACICYLLGAAQYPDWSWWIWYMGWRQCRGISWLQLLGGVCWTCSRVIQKLRRSLWCACRGSWNVRTGWRLRRGSGSEPWWLRSLTRTQIKPGEAHSLALAATWCHNGLLWRTCMDYDWRWTRVGAIDLI